METERPKVLQMLQLRRIIFKQMAWFMVLPFLTVIFVVAIVYLDRMHNLKEMTIQQESLRLETIGHAVSSRLQFYASDLRFLSNNLLGRSYSPEAEEQIREVLSGFLAWKTEYLAIHVLDAQGTELIRELGRGGAGEEEQHQPHLLFPASAQSLPRDSLFITYSAYGHTGKIEPLHNSEVISMGYAAGDRTGQQFLVIDLPLSALFKTLGNSVLDDSRRLFFTDNRSSAFWRVLERAHPGISAKGSGDSALLPDDFPESALSEIRENINGQTTHGSFFTNGNLYIFSKEEPFSGLFPGSQMKEVSGGNDAADLHTYHLVLFSEIASTWFLSHRDRYIQFLLVLAIALLVPSFVVCYYLAKARVRVVSESTLRHQEHLSHMADLEHKVRQRTRELDDSNLQLSAEIAERLSAEKQLKRSNEFLSGMMESIDGIIYVADFDSHEILFANEYLKRLFGFDPVGRQCWQFIHSNQEGPCEFCTNRKLLDQQGEPTGSYQWEYQNPFNKKWYAAKDQAIKWSNGKYVRLEIAVDITEQKRLQHFLQDARKQAELTKGTRMRFVALVAHDLKAPFFSITQMLRRILERETFAHRVHRQFLENIVENGHRILLMIDNLLSIDRFEAGDVKLETSFFDASEMAGEVLKNFEHLAFEKSVELINEIPAGSTVFADKYLYFVVLNNLISNAVKFSDPGGRVTLYVPDQKRPMTIAVKDTGKGMSTEYLQGLFKEDVRTSRKGTKGEKGSGLGLIFCQDILKAHSGFIHVESEPGIGTVFTIELPECSAVQQG